MLLIAFWCVKRLAHYVTSHCIRLVDDRNCHPVGGANILGIVRAAVMTSDTGVSFTQVLTGGHIFFFGDTSDCPRRNEVIYKTCMGVAEPMSR